MRIAAIRTRERRRGAPESGVVGTARVDRREDRLLRRLHPGDIAVLDATDLGRATADALVAAKVGGVVNAQASVSGRYPTLGPQVLIDNGIPLLDSVGADLFVTLKEGTRVRLDDDALFAGDRQLATGVRQDAATVAASLVVAKRGLAAHLEAFAASTSAHMQRERELLIDGVGIPDVATPFAGRHVVMVSRGYDFVADLKGLKHYIREFRPVLIGVDAGADALRDAGYRPDLVIGDLDDMSDVVLQEAGEVVAHADLQGRVRGLARVQDLRIEPRVFPTSSTSEDAAMLIADAREARLIVTVGMRATLEEFLDAGRGSIASTVLTRLKLGGRVVDAKAAAQLYQTRISGLVVLALALAALLAIAVVLVASNAGQSYLHLVNDGWDNSVAWLKDLFS